ncbi:MAG TPA: ABC transporter permease [Candidatus Dormibacteraeota bacterium]|nr:ABC transporter permease [Candidatus Dormibacteraeota bacterium]
MSIFRNLTRRKLRSSLTISGIVIGIVALTTMGAMANNFNALLNGGVTYYGDHVTVNDSSAGSSLLSSGVLPTSKIAEIQRVTGVAAAFPEITILAQPGKVQVVSFGLPDLIAASTPNEARYASEQSRLASGRNLTSNSTGEVVLGSSMAAEFGKKLGDTIDLPVRPADATSDFVSHTYKVVGILAPTKTMPDTTAFVSLTDAQTLLKDSLPASLRGSVDATQVANSVSVYGTPGSNLDQLAGRINDQVAGVKAVKPSDQVAAFKSGGAIFTAITTGAALLALIIGGLSVLNTMIMAISERVREIGLKKAIGASTFRVMREVVVEATLIGFVGGAIGFGLGAGVALLLNALTPASQPVLFLVTPGLAAVSLGFATLLGAVAGVIPAFRAARLDPVTALRAQ